MFLNKENLILRNKYNSKDDIDFNKNVQLICKKFNISEDEIEEKFIKRFYIEIKKLKNNDFINYIKLYRNVLLEVYWKSDNFFRYYYYFLKSIWRYYNIKINSKNDIEIAKNFIINELYSIFEWCYLIFWDTSKVWFTIDSLLWYPYRWDWEFSRYEYWDSYYEEKMKK